MKTRKKNPGELTCKQRLAEALRERDEASTACMALIELAQKLIGKLTAMQIASANNEAEQARKAIAKIRVGKVGRLKKEEHELGVIYEKNN